MREAEQQADMREADRPRCQLRTENPQMPNNQASAGPLSSPKNSPPPSFSPFGSAQQLSPPPRDCVPSPSHFPLHFPFPVPGCPCLRPFFTAKIVNSSVYAKVWLLLALAVFFLSMDTNLLLFSSCLNFRATPSFHKKINYEI